MALGSARWQPTRSPRDRQSAPVLDRCSSVQQQTDDFARRRLGASAVIDDHGIDETKQRKHQRARRTSTQAQNPEHDESACRSWRTARHVVGSPSIRAAGMLFENYHSSYRPIKSQARHYQRRWTRRSAVTTTCWRRFQHFNDDIPKTRPCHLPRRQAAIRAQPHRRFISSTQKDVNSHATITKPVESSITPTTDICQQRRRREA